MILNAIKMALLSVICFGWVWLALFGIFVTRTRANFLIKILCWLCTYQPLMFVMFTLYLSNYHFHRFLDCKILYHFSPLIVLIRCSMWAWSGQYMIRICGNGPEWQESSIHHSVCLPWEHSAWLNSKKTCQRIWETAVNRKCRFGSWGPSQRKNKNWNWIFPEYFIPYLFQCFHDCLFIFVNLSWKWDSIDAGDLVKTIADWWKQRLPIDSLCK